MQKCLSYVSCAMLVLAAMATAPAHAAHQRGIRATIDSLDPATLVADIYVTAYTTQTRTNTDFRSIQWGEGETSTQGTASLTLAFVGAQPSAPGYATWRGTFSHTYTAGTGPFTLRVVSDTSGTYLGEIVSEGGPATGNPITRGGGPATTPQDFVLYFTNTALVDFSQVPALPHAVLWLAAGLLATGGALIVWRGMA